jgi:two-component sensor histidine kinase
MSHELRTPLNAVIGFSEVLDRETFGPLGHQKYQDYVKDIIASGRHLLDMINDILDMSKIEAGKYELHMSQVDLAQTVREALQVISAEIDKKQLALRTELSADLPLILGDKRAIKQVLLNLLSNAVKFSPEKSEIVVRAEQAADGTISLSVQDTGIGIAKDDIENVMKPFNQVGSAQTNARTGTGLGLPIVKSLIDMHGGRFVLHAKAFHGNPYDGHTLAAIIPDMEKTIGNQIGRILADAGYPEDFADPVIPILSTALAGNPEFGTMAELMQVFMEEVGLQTEMVELDWAVGGEELGTLACDGVICATPSGSTGYNLSNGGPVMMWGLEAMAMTFVAPHALNTRPLVVPRGLDLRVRNRAEELPVTVLVDGHEVGGLGPERALAVGVGDKTCRLALLPEVTFFSRYHDVFP